MTRGPVGVGLGRSRYVTICLTTPSLDAAIVTKRPLHLRQGAQVRIRVGAEWASGLVSTCFEIEKPLPNRIRTAVRLARSLAAMPTALPALPLNTCHVGKGKDVPVFIVNHHTTKCVGSGGYINPARNDQFEDPAALSLSKQYPVRIR